LNILFNEAERQRAIDTYYISIAFGGDKEGFEMLNRLTKIHGPYTEGFYESERKRFERLLKNGKNL